jgi:hypothetical protein
MEQPIAALFLSKETVIKSASMPMDYARISGLAIKPESRFKFTKSTNKDPSTTINKSLHPNFLTFGYKTALNCNLVMLEE